MKPSRDIPEFPLTPEWCKYRKQIMQDVIDDQEMGRLGIRGLTRADLLPMVKALPPAFRGTPHESEKPWKLTEMNAEMMRHAILNHHRSAAPQETGE